MARISRQQAKQGRKDFQKHNRGVLIDIIMLICTCGLWGFVMARRNKKNR